MDGYDQESFPEDAASEEALLKAFDGIDDEAKLCELEKRVTARLTLFDKLRGCDLHTAAWLGDTALVRAHLEIAGSKSEKQANAIDETEFGGGYRPLHYAAYAGRAETVRLLLQYGADVDARNDVGCTALFLAAQQGRAEVVRILAKTDWCDNKHLVPAGDGRLVCPLDVARAVDKASGRAQTRALLLDALRDSTARPRKPAPPDVSSAPGGVHVRWRKDDYAPLSPAPPTHHVKVKVVDVAGQEAAALVVVRASANRVRVTGLLPGRDYVALLAGVNAVGAGAYSGPSTPARAAEDDSTSAAARDERQVSDEQDPPATERRLDPRIVRARNAVIEGREKRQRVAMLLKAETERQRASVARYYRQRAHHDDSLP